MKLTTGIYEPGCTISPDRSKLTNILRRATSRTRCAVWLLSLASLVSAQALLAATLATDKPDYIPGETVTFTGAGWQPGETVTIDIYETTVDPFFWEGSVSPVADANGNISNSELLVQQSFLGQGFSAIATGQSSGLSASTTFTDANPSAGLDEGQNGALNNGTNAASISPVNWASGNQNSTKAHYIEAQSVPYRMVLQNLTNGPHTLDIEWDIRVNGVNAIDYITDYPCLQPHTFFNHSAEIVDPLWNLVGTLVTNPYPTVVMAGIPVPIPSRIVFGVPQPQTSFNNPGCTKVVTMFNGTTIDSVSYIAGGLGNVNAASSSTGLRIAFHTVNPTVVFAWGGHLASVGDWGSGQSVSSISGSSYHTRLLALDGSGGNQDSQLAVSAVYPPPQCAGFSGPGFMCRNSQ